MDPPAGLRAALHRSRGDKSEDIRDKDKSRGDGGVLTCTYRGCPQTYKSTAPLLAKNARNGAPSLSEASFTNRSVGHPPSHPGRALTVDSVGALSDFDDVAIGIADVAAYLAVLWNRRRDELGSSTFP